MENRNKGLEDAVFRATGGKIDREAMKNAANGDTATILNKLSEADRKKIEAALKNPQLLSAIMRDKDARKILSQFVGSK